MGFNIGAALIQGPSREQVLEHLGAPASPELETTVMDATLREYQYTHGFIGELAQFHLVIANDAVERWCDEWLELSRGGCVFTFFLSENWGGTNHFEYYEDGRLRRRYVEAENEWTGEALAVEDGMNKESDHPADMIDRVLQDLTGGARYCNNLFLNVPVRGWRYD